MGCSSQVNLNVTDPDVVPRFYRDVLGLTINPKGSAALAPDGETRQWHVNAGLSQFHCAWRDPDGTHHKDADVWSGEVGRSNLSNVLLVPSNFDQIAFVCI